MLRKLSETEVNIYVLSTKISYEQGELLQSCFEYIKGISVDSASRGLQSQVIERVSAKVTEEMEELNINPIFEGVREAVQLSNWYIG